MILISCQHNEILQALRRINSVVLKSKRARNDYMISLNLKINSIEIIGQGLTIYIDGNTDSFGVVSIPFLILWRLVQDWKEDHFQLIFDNVKVKCGNRTIESPFIKITHPENFPKNDLTMNPSKLEMLALKKLENLGIIKPIKVGKEVFYINNSLFDILSGK